MFTSVSNSSFVSTSSVNGASTTSIEAISSGSNLSVQCESKTVNGKTTSECTRNGEKITKFSCTDKKCTYEGLDVELGYFCTCPNDEASKAGAMTAVAVLSAILFIYVSPFVFLKFFRGKYTLYENEVVKR